MEEVLLQLLDPAPPSAHGNYYDTVLKEFVRNPDCLITERAWHLFRETNCWGRPYWVIQGTKGGHKRWFSQNEQKLLKMAGLPTDPPAPGDLPYAEFDDRVLVQLEKLDMLRSEQGQLKRRGSILGKNAHQIREEEDGKKFRLQLVSFLKEQMEEIAPDVHKGLLGIDAARSTNDPGKMEEVMELAEHDFIETGNSKASLLRIER
ncbi:MAG: hypothetical protein H0U55_07705 [Rubrobacteraceae bacterium]|nr:hypothetical protein [Rubrobacteraceae bacterium]